MKNLSSWFFIIGIMFLLDVYVFQVAKFLLQGATSRTKWIVYVIFWVLSVFAMVFVILIPYIRFDFWPKNLRNYLFVLVVGLLFAKIIAALFFLIDDLRRGSMWLIGKIAPKMGPQFVGEASDLISRSTFLSWLGIGIGGGLFSSLIYGFSNKYNYQIKRYKLSFPNLPKAFKGLKMIHISDIHSGSFNNKSAVEIGVQKIMNEKADIIFFTGDLVNDRAIEMEEYKDVFSKIQAPLGVFSTLGNHDYGDYVSWDSIEAKRKNLQDLKDTHSQMNWKLLMNEHIEIKKEKDSIAIIGIENWSAKGRFPKYGKMEDAYAGTENIPFKILLSHDPSHWEAEIIPKYPAIDLMLSGHTHGMQFGLENPYFKFSPVQWVYKQWAGLYENGSQKINVNRGFGFIGYPGRVGILPEITVIELI
jgi:predicted MPP superfamily phosphohydrolase